MSESDKMFNCKLTIQKLEEELALYRNGTSGEDLIEVINEKDCELNELRRNLSEVTEGYTKVGTALKGLLPEFDALKKEKAELTQMVELKCGELVERDSTISQLRSDVESLTRQVSSLDADLSTRNEENKYLMADVEKLQMRCSVLVNESREKTQFLNSEKSLRAKEVKEMRDELDRAMRCNTELKVLSSDLNEEIETKDAELMSAKSEITSLKSEINRIQNEYTALQQKLKGVSTELSAAQSQVCDKTREADDLRMVYSQRIEERNKRERELQQVIVTREDSIRELTHDLDCAKRALQDANRDSRVAMEDRERYWKAEVNRLEKLAETNATRLQKLEVEREKYLSDKRDFDILKAKYSNLEDKIKRQEAYMKNRLLRDRSNTLHAPDAVLKPSMQNKTQRNSTVYRTEEL
eukprot:CAMPEP_0185027636 /NCGR_PEP_ID=MMETSP1103-20130426/12889_1 /TAXON_ID=36769 /ORGANISM="Paraphysomonas bandaiensis, Strain Caron Lab Isolate" /LENGTH=410 /DNA_ID=CAMNT_0027561733 /DNA_START=79 /DNA_END=1311 /DNA_ORIENTATION=-